MEELTSKGVRTKVSSASGALAAGDGVGAVWADSAEVLNARTSRAGVNRKDRSLGSMGFIGGRNGGEVVAAGCGDVGER